MKLLYVNETELVIDVHRHGGNVCVTAPKALVAAVNDLNRTPFSGRHEATMSVIHGRPVRSLATNREPAVGG